MSVELSWYGERGIVNALVTRLSSLGVDGVKKFLQCIDWADSDRNQWIDDVVASRMVVEVGLGQFGDPDLIIVSKTEKGAIYAVFIEAKAVPYFYSAGQGGRSRIHRQLTLKHRFTLALAESQNNSRIIESSAIHTHYQRGFGNSDLADECTYPRQLAKPSVLKVCRDAGLFDTPVENFRFVAWTWDSTAFFESEDFRSSSARPLFLDVNGTEDWTVTSRKIGWLGYSTIFAEEDLSDALFRQAFYTMMPGPKPVDVPAIADGDSSLTTYNINRKSLNSTKERLSQLEVTAEQYFPPGSVKRLPGSTSVTLTSPATGQPKVIAKLLPRSPGPNEFIALGISASLQRATWGDRDFRGPTNVAQQAFFLFDLPNSDEALDIASKVFEEIAECISAEDESEGA